MKYLYVKVIKNNMFYIGLFNLSYLKYFIKILLILYYKNLKYNKYIIISSCKFILLIKIFFIIYFNYNIYNKCINLSKNYLNNKIKKLIHNILYINNTSKVNKTNIIKKFSVISIIGNKNNWIGIGVSKNVDLSTAVQQSYKKSFKNIINIYNKNIINKYNIFKFKNTKLILHNNNFNYKSSHILFNIFKLVGIPIKSKIIGVSSNIFNIITIFKKLSLFNYY